MIITKKIKIIIYSICAAIFAATLIAAIIQGQQIKALKAENKNLKKSNEVKDDYINKLEKINQDVSDADIFDPNFFNSYWMPKHH